MTKTGLHHLPHQTVKASVRLLWLSDGLTVSSPPPQVLEVHQFSRDAGVAETWLLAQDPYLSSWEMGQSVDEVEKLIKRHEAFEKSAATWEERFSALERLTTVSTEGQGSRLDAVGPKTNALVAGTF